VHQEFNISVTPDRHNPDDYLIRIEDMAKGVPLAEEFVTWNLDEWLAEASQLMNDPLLDLLRGNMVAVAGGAVRTLPDELADVDLSPNLVAFGQKLYNALFQGRIRDSWVTAQGIAQNRQESLRLRLGLKGDRLQRLPWEVLHAGNRPVATGTDVIFSRYQSNFTPLANELQLHQHGNDQTLRILMVLAAPSDQEVLQLEQEAENLRQELLSDGANGNGEQPDIHLEILRQPGRERLTQELEHGQYHVFHYAGHSDLGAAGGDVYLVSNQTGLTEVLGGDDLAGLLVNNGIRLAVFNSCRGVYAATTDPNSAAGNLADALLKRGIPAVLAMAERIPDNVALSLSRLFYRSLKQKHTVDLSLSRARQGLISSYSSDQLYWALPILYLHPEFDGYLQRRQPSQGGSLPAFDPMDEDADLDLDLLADLQEEPDVSDRRTVEDLFRELTAPAGTPRGWTATDQPRLDDPADAAARSFQQCLTLGQKHYNSGDYQSAIATYTTALNLPELSNEQAAELCNQSGLALEASGKLADAITAFKHAMDLDATLEDAHDNWQRATLRQEAAQVALGSTPQPVPPQPSSAHQPPSARPSLSASGRQMSTTPAWRRPKVLVPGIVAIVLIGGLGLWGTRLISGPPGPNDLLGQVPDYPTPTPSPNPSNAPKTAELTAKATQSFAKKDLAAGQQAVEALLDQQALLAAKQALDTVPPEQIDNPDISFLRGRLAWQSARIKDADFNVQDARRSWEIAVKAKPEPRTYNLLGLALYSEGKWNEAGEAWKKALDLIAENQKSAAKSAANSTASAVDLETATAYAGLALVAQKLAAQPNQAQNMRAEAVKLRNQALAIAPQDLQPRQLWLSWRWSVVAVKDWQKLIAIK
jgi:tetratricopeptide (TPR) repeat protein